MVTAGYSAHYLDRKLFITINGCEVDNLYLSY